MIKILEILKSLGIVNTYGPCVGLTLYRVGIHRAECWYIPAWYTIVEHTHPNENVELMFIFGKTNFWRRNLTTGVIKSVETSWRFFARRFSVKYFHSHKFTTTSWPLVFINFQTFLFDMKPKSAAEDFQIVKTD